MASDVVVIYEAVNQTLKEIYVGMSDKPTTPNDLARQHALSLPLPINHWEPDHNISYRLVETGLPLQDARDFIHAYAVEISNVGWRVVTD